MSNKRKLPRKVIRTSNPRKLGGNIAGPGGPHDVGGVILDTGNAVLLSKVDVSTLDYDVDGSKKSIVAMLLGGRINRTQDTSSILYLFGTDGVAAIVTELLSLLGRVTGIDPTDLLSDIVERMSNLREEGNLT